MSGWQLMPKGLAAAGLSGKRHVLNPSLHTAVTVFESERGAIRHSDALGEVEMTPREAVLRLAIHRPDIFEVWRKP